MRPTAALLVLLLGVAGAAGPEFALRRQRLAAGLGPNGYAVVLGQPLTNALRPGQEGHFLYLTGLRQPDCALLLAAPEAPAIDLGARPTREVLFLPDVPPQTRRFYGWRHGPGPETERELGVELAVPGGRAVARPLVSALPRNARLHLPPYAASDQALVRALRREIVAAVEGGRPDVEIVDLRPRLAAMRSVKEPGEIEAMRSAVGLALLALREALPQIRPGSGEGAVEGALVNALRRRGSRPGFPFVVASGANGAIPHYFDNDGPLRDGELLLIDLGATSGGYVSDFTRTFPISGRFTERQHELYDAVLRAQRAAIEAVRPGGTLRDVHAAALAVLAERDLARFVLHGSCHHVGLEVHDPGPGLLAPGMTIAVEPGIYLAEERLGIRIEDLVLVTEEGREVLSRAFPKDAKGIEALLASR